jgi:uncharacterized protein YqhQ
MKEKEKFQYGGMAVIEGVMMQGPKRIAVAVRKPDGSIAVEIEENKMGWKRYPFLKWPLIRGSYVLIKSMIVGMKMLNKSANLSMDEEEEELSTLDIFITGLVAFALAMALFVILPVTIVHYTSTIIGGVFAQNIVEGIIRMVFFLLYVFAISKMKEIERVFMYHGAEHKTISTYEAGEELTVANARRYSTLHPRCGTSFLLMVMIISILVFAMLGDGNLLYRITSRIAVFPIVAGLGYEFIKFSGRHCTAAWAKVFIAPGLQLQRLTTRPPDDQMLEVAIAALKAVLVSDKDDVQDAQEETAVLQQAISLEKG